MAALFDPLTLPCGAVLANRIAKPAMSDSLGDGRGDPSDTQIRLYERWAEGGLGLSIVGEVQHDPMAAEKPGNLVLHPGSDAARLRELARRGSAHGTALWLQLGHAGAMAHPPISVPRGPSALSLPDLKAAALTQDQIAALPAAFAGAARRARDLGFGGVELHAAHGFLLSQFLSPLFNRRTDAHGGPIENRMRLPLAVVDAVRAAVGADFPVGIKINATDQLEGGLTEADALTFVAALDATSIDLIDISGGTYFPGAKSASDSGGAGPYFRAFARTARKATSKPLMLTGGIKTRAQAEDVIESGDADIAGLARAHVLVPDLTRRWRAGGTDPAFPRFADPPEGGITAWYSMALTRLGQDRAPEDPPDLPRAIAEYDTRDAQRAALWRDRFGAPERCGCRADP